MACLTASANILASNENCFFFSLDLEQNKTNHTVMKILLQMSLLSFNTVQQKIRRACVHLTLFSLYMYNVYTCIYI